MSTQTIESHESLVALAEQRRDLQVQHREVSAEIDHLTRQKQEQVLRQPTYHNERGDEVLIGLEETNAHLAAAYDRLRRINASLRDVETQAEVTRRQLRDEAYAQQHAAIDTALATLREMAVLCGEQVQAAQRVLNSYNTQLGESRWPLLAVELGALAHQLGRLLA